MHPYYKYYEITDDKFGRLMSVSFEIILLHEVIIKLGIFKIFAWSSQIVIFSLLGIMFSQRVAINTISFMLLVFLQVIHLAMKLAMQVNNVSRSAASARPMAMHATSPTVLI